MRTECMRNKCKQINKKKTKKKDLNVYEKSDMFDFVLQ